MKERKLQKKDKERLDDLRARMHDISSLPFWKHIWMKYAKLELIWEYEDLMEEFRNTKKYLLENNLIKP